MVSIILPNLNTPLKFLKVRLDSIIQQNFKDWECIIIDGLSNNGSYEYILEYTRSDSRFSYYQKEKKGIYNAWNEGIKLAKNEYICIATSDDSFRLDFLEHMESALRTNPDCGISHCCLEIIDANDELTSFQWKDWEKVKFYGDLINQYHIRRAPYDAIVHFGWSTVYTSITQVLIKKKVFEIVGLFNEEFGPSADYEWGLRASMLTDIVHVPLFLSSWRRHEGQATDETFLSSSSFYSMLIKMSESAMKQVKANNGVQIVDEKSVFLNYCLMVVNKASKIRKVNSLWDVFRFSPKIFFKIVFLLPTQRYSFDTSKFIHEELTKRVLNQHIIPIKL